MVETVFGMLGDQFKLGMTNEGSLWGGTCIVAKLLTFDLSISLDRLMGRLDLAIKDRYL